MVGAPEAARLATDLVGPDAVVIREGSGWDHEAWRVVGRDGRPWIVRCGIEGAADELAAEVRREVAVMRAARAVLGDLVAEAVVLDEPRGCLAYPRVPGTPLQELLAAGRVPAPAGARLAREIGSIITAIATVGAPAGVEAEDGLPAWYAGLPDFVEVVEHLLSAGERASLAALFAGV